METASICLVCYGCVYIFIYSAETQQEINNLDCFYYGKLSYKFYRFLFFVSLAEKVMVCIKLEITKNKTKYIGHLIPHTSSSSKSLK